MSANLKVVQPEILPLPTPAPHSSGMFNIPGCTFTPVGMILEPNLPIEHWIAAGLALRRAGDAFQLCIGDWISYGKHTYKHGEMYERALAITGFKERTLQNNVWVARKVPLELRAESSPRGEVLKFKHYKTVASLSTKDQIKKWLRRAIKGDGNKIWSASRLKKEITRASQPEQKEDETFVAALIKVHTKVVREELDERILAVDGWLQTPSSEVLTTVYRRLKQILEWQRDRTLEKDCAAIISMFTGDVGTEAPERVTDVDLHAWLQSRGFIMSRDEIGQPGFKDRDIDPSGRIGLMIKLHLITAETREESRGEIQRGVITHVYKGERSYLSALEEIDLKFDEPSERRTAQRKEWKKRVALYAPELMPKEEEKTEGKTDNRKSS